MWPWNLFLVVGDHITHQLLASANADKAQSHAALRKSVLTFEAADVATPRMRADQDQLAASIRKLPAGCRHRMHVHAGGEIDVRAVDDDEIAVVLADSRSVALDREARPTVV